MIHKKTGKILLFLLLLILAGLCPACSDTEQKEGVRVTLESITRLPDDLFLNPAEGYESYGLIVRVENLGDYEIPFSATTDLSFSPQESVTVIRGASEILGCQTQGNVPPHGEILLAAPFVTGDLEILEEVVYNTKQPQNEKTVALTFQTDNLLRESQPSSR